MTPTRAPTITKEAPAPATAMDRPALEQASSARGLTAEVDMLALLTTLVDRISADQPLSEHPGLRAQMRRSAMDAISYAACAAEAESAHDYQRFMLRTLSALRELGTFTRMGVARRAVSPAQASRIGGLVVETALSLERSLQRDLPHALDQAAGRPAIGLSGAA